jgi:glyoxylase-like metal-dependent hydrolase (beta-lactamase superfamily II)
MALRVVRSRFGDTEVVQIVETEIGRYLKDLLPDTTPENIRAIRWLAAPYRNEDCSLNALSQCFIVQIAKRIFVVDTCIGNDKRVPGFEAWQNMQTDFLETLAGLAIDRAAVTDVICTHLHVDHIGWNTYRKDGRWLPTFPNAKYHLSKADFDEYSEQLKSPGDELLAASMAESILPIVDAGLANFIEPDVDLGDGITVISTPGHTKGHIAIRFQTGSEQFIIAGDSFHHPCQVARPEWPTAADYSKDQSIATRKRLLAELAGSRTLLAGTHFCSPSFGYISADPAGGYEFKGSK